MTLRRSPVGCGRCASAGDAACERNPGKLEKEACLLTLMTHLYHQNDLEYLLTVVLHSLGSLVANVLRLLGTQFEYVADDRRQELALIAP